MSLEKLCLVGFCCPWCPRPPLLHRQEIESSRELLLVACGGMWDWKKLSKQ